MKIEEGTLDELNVNPGDVVECIDHWYSIPDVFTVGKTYTVETCGIVSGKAGATGLCAKFRIIRRASDTPPLLGELTDAEIGALVRAHNEGEVIEVYNRGTNDWGECPLVNLWHEDAAYRVKPEPVREPVTIYINEKGETSPRDGTTSWAATRAITFDKIDGKIDDSTPPKMERVK